MSKYTMELEKAKNFVYKNDLILNAEILRI